MKIQMILSAAFAAIVCFFAPSFAAAQTDSCPAHAHLQAEIRACVASGVEFGDCACVCDRGYHPRDSAQPVSSSNPCVRDEPSWGSYRDPLCAFGAVRGDNGECMCPDTLGARRARTLVVVSRDFASAIADQIEDYDSLRRERGPVALQACINPLATAGENGSAQALLLDALDSNLRIICAAPETATDEAFRQACIDTRALIDSIGPRTTIHYGDREYTFNEFVNDVLVPKFAEIEGRLSALEARVDDLEPRVEALENRPDALRTFLDVTHARLGAGVRLGYLVDSMATFAGFATGELLIRFGDAPVGMFGRIEFGGQTSGWDVGESLYLAGGAGLAFFTGGRRDTTISLGLFAEDLLEPFADDPQGVMGSEVGVALGVEVAASIPLPGDAHWVRLRPGIDLAYGERSFMDNDVFTTASGFYFAGTLGVEFQPDF